MLPRLLFLFSVLAATLAVVLLAILPHPTLNAPNAARHVSLSFHLHLSPRRPPPPTIGPKEALVFHHLLTVGSTRTSRPVGFARGFVVPTGSFARSPFNIVYFAIKDRGTVGVDARDLRQEEREELRVVGGTGDFVFASGVALLRRVDAWDRATIAFRVEIRLQLPSSDPPRHDAGSFNPP